jgi:hypothetical protein
MYRHPALRLPPSPLHQTRTHAAAAKALLPCLLPACTLINVSCCQNATHTPPKPCCTRAHERARHAQLSACAQTTHLVHCCPQLTHTNTVAGAWTVDQPAGSSSAASSMPQIHTAMASLCMLVRVLLHAGAACCWRQQRQGMLAHAQVHTHKQLHTDTECTVFVQSQC